MERSGLPSLEHMKQTLLRKPEGAEIVADLARALGMIGIVVAAIGWGPKDALSIAGAVLVTFLPRLLGIRPAVDISFTVTVNVAAWSAVLAIYEQTLWWDIPVHFAFNGLIALLLYVGLVHLRVLGDAREMPRPLLTSAVTVTAIGLSLGVLWELLEWFVRFYIDPETYVGYTDSLGDLVAGGLGSLVAGCFIRFLSDGSRLVGTEVAPVTAERSDDDTAPTQARA